MHYPERAPALRGSTSDAGGRRLGSCRGAASWASVRPVVCVGVNGRLSGIG